MTISKFTISRILILGMAVITLVLSGCIKKEDEALGDPLTELNKGLKLPPGAYTIDGNTATDNTVSITSGGGGNHATKNRYPDERTNIL